MIFIKQNIFDLKETDLKEKFNTIVSDLAPFTSGIKIIDSGRSLELSKKAFEIAKSFLMPGGNFICKIFESENANNFLKEIKKNFRFFKKFRPKAVSKRSKEFYIIGKYFIL